MKKRVEWEGVVLEVYEDTFLARLIDIHGDDDEEEAEIFTDIIPFDERKYITEGAIFHWRIFENEEGRRYNELVFLKEPVWTNEDIEKAKREAELLRKLWWGSEE